MHDSPLCAYCVACGIAHLMYHVRVHLRYLIVSDTQYNVYVYNIYIHTCIYICNCIYLYIQAYIYIHSSIHPSIHPYIHTWVDYYHRLSLWRRHRLWLIRRGRSPKITIFQVSELLCSIQNPDICFGRSVWYTWYESMMYYCININIHIQSYTYTYTYIHTYIYIHTCIYIYIYIHIYTRVYIYVYIYIHTYTYIHTYIIHIYIYVNIYTYIYIYSCNMYSMYNIHMVYICI